MAAESVDNPNMRPLFILKVAAQAIALLLLGWLFAVLFLSLDILTRAR